jgi:hypothetical protein
MPKFRIEVEERHTTTREKVIEAASAEEALLLAEQQDDWRTFTETGTDIDSRISNVELCDDDITPEEGVR